MGASSPRFQRGSEAFRQPAFQNRLFELRGRYLITPQVRFFTSLETSILDGESDEVFSYRLPAKALAYAWNGFELSSAAKIREEVIPLRDALLLQLEAWEQEVQEGRYQALQDCFKNSASTLEPTK